MKLMVVVALLPKHEYFKTGRNQLRINLAKPDVCAVQSKQAGKSPQMDHL